MGRLGRPRTWLFIALALVSVLIAVRLALPSIVKRYVNRTLGGLEGYTGSVDDIDLSLWRGAYQIKGLRIDKSGGKVPVPFLSSDLIDLHVEWAALLHGSIVAEIELYTPKLNFVNSKKPEKSQAKPNSSFVDTARDLVPFNINRVSIHDGQIHYRDLESDPRVDIFVQKLDATARNLTNSESFNDNLYASFDGSALAMGSGKIGFKGSLNPYAPAPTFGFAFELDGLELKQLNPFLKAYANVDAQKGTFSLDAEFDAHDGKFRGVAKPFVKNLQLLKWNQEEEGFFGKLWEGAVQLVAEVFTDHSKDQIATRIPFSGTVSGPNPDIFATLGGLLKNAFLQSLKRGLEGGLGGSGTKTTLLSDSK